MKTDLLLATSATTLGLLPTAATAQDFGTARLSEHLEVLSSDALEENGLLGSEYYTTHPLYPAYTTVAVLTDAMGIAGGARESSISGTASLDLLNDLVAEAKKPETLPLGRRPSGKRRLQPLRPLYHGQGRHSPVSFEFGSDLVNGGVVRAQALREDHVTHRYHLPDDESPDWEFSGMAEDGQLQHHLSLRLANSREWPNWSADSEFHAIRDGTSADRAGTPVKASGKGEKG